MQPLDDLDSVKLIHTGDDSPNKYVPMIMVTGHSEQNKVTQSRDAGINELLIKPLSAKTLYPRIKAVIERPAPLSNPNPISDPTDGAGQSLRSLSSRAIKRGTRPRLPKFRNELWIGT